MRPCGSSSFFLSLTPSPRPLLLSDADQLFLERQKASVVSTFFNLSQGILGAGSFGIPAALAFTGLSGGLALMVLVAAISALTMWMLAEVRWALVWPYFFSPQQAWCRLCVRCAPTATKACSPIRWAPRCRFCPSFSSSSTVMVALVCLRCRLTALAAYGASVLYLQLLRDNFHSPIRFLAGRDEWYTDPRFIICVFTVFVCGPMCLFRTMHTLSRFSTLGVAVVVLSVLFVGECVPPPVFWH